PPFQVTYGGLGIEVDAAAGLGEAHREIGVVAVGIAGEDFVEAADLIERAFADGAIARGKVRDEAGFGGEAVEELGLLVEAGKLGTIGGAGGEVGAEEFLAADAVDGWSGTRSGVHPLRRGGSGGVAPGYGPAALRAGGRRTSDGARDFDSIGRG